jgi:hypothetical protein
VDFRSELLGCITQGFIGDMRITGSRLGLRVPEKLANNLKRDSGGYQVACIRVPKVMYANGRTVSGEHPLLAFDLECLGQSCSFASLFPRAT